VDHVVLVRPIDGSGPEHFRDPGRPHGPTHRRIFVNAEQAAQTPVEQSDHKLEAASRQIAQALEAARRQEFVRGVDDQARSGPAMVR
jgi:hypothetical protein